MRQTVAMLLAPAAVLLSVAAFGPGPGAGGSVRLVALRGDSIDAPLKPSPLKAGDAVPAVTLKDTEGRAVTMGSMYAERPVVVMFYRGGWCPYCNESLKEWGQALGEFKGAGVDVVAVSMEKPEKAKAVREKLKTGYALLIDEDGEAARAFGVAFAVDDETKAKLRKYNIDLGASNASGRWELPVPGTFLIDTTGKVRHAFANEDYTKRADPDEFLAQAKRVMAEKK